MLCDDSRRHSAAELAKYHQLKTMLTEKFDVARKKYGLKKSELTVLIALMLSDETTNTSTELCKLSGMNKTQMSKLLDSLHGRGYVYFKTDEKDRRYVHYYIGDNAEPIVNDIIDAWEFMRGHVFKGVTKEEEENYLKVSKQIHKNLYELMDNLGN